MKTITLALGVSSLLHAGLLAGYGFSHDDAPDAGDTLTISLLDQSAIARSASVVAHASAGGKPAESPATHPTRPTTAIPAAPEPANRNDGHGIADVVVSRAGERDRAASPAADHSGERLRRRVARFFSDQFVYPATAQRRGIEGSVTVRVAIDETGRITRFEIAQGSGYRVLDDATLASIGRTADNTRIVTGRPHTPLEVEFPVQYRLVGN